MRGRALAAILLVAGCAPDAPVSLPQFVDAGTSATADSAVVADVDAGDVVQVDVAPDSAKDPCAGLDCDDGNACTNDVCVPLTGCSHGSAQPGTSCDNGGTCDGTGNCTSSVPLGMVLIPSGTFWMGCNSAKDGNCHEDEKPQHSVTLSAYYMDLTETTVGQYKACVDAGVCTEPSSVQPDPTATYPGLTNHPVNYLNWMQSRQFCQWRGAAYDLPTEAQWELAARGSCEQNGSQSNDAGCAAAMRTYPWGEAVATCSYAVMSDGTYGCGTNATWAVGSKTSGDSPYGLHDMAGNIWEWNRDWYGPYSLDAQTDPSGPSSASYRVLRGGVFGGVAVDLRAGHRNPEPPSSAYVLYGLRCMRSVP